MNYLIEQNEKYPLLVFALSGLLIFNFINLFSEEEYFFEVAEAVFVGWFTFEYAIRFIAAPNKFL